jgi:formate-dependent nitrite reductase membrane component NrfD
MSDTGIRKEWIITAVLGAFLVIGAVLHFTQGPSMADPTYGEPWGVMIATFFFLAGGAAGAVMLAALPQFQVKGTELQRRALNAMSLGLGIGAAMTIFLHMGRPLVAWRMIIGNWGSLFAWDGVSLGAVIIVAIVGFFVERSRILGGLGIVTGTALLLVEGLIMSTSPSRPLWTMTAGPAVFILAGLATGVALALLLTSASSEPSVATLFRWMLAAMTALIAVLSLEDMVAAALSGEQGAANVAWQVLSSPGGAVFYLSLILLAIGASTSLLSKKAASLRWAAVASLLGIYLSKVDLLTAGQSQPLITLFGTSSLVIHPSSVLWTIGAFAVVMASLLVLAPPLTRTGSIKA